jgi:isocitrate/isopropylmalate dehydrogenase
MILAAAALLTHGDETMKLAGNAIRQACLDAIQAGVRTGDLGGNCRSSEFVTDVIARVRTLLSL